MNNKPNTYNDDLLKQYLEGKLSGDALHQFELQMQKSAMLNDAVEGLQQIKQHQNIDQYVSELNKQLQAYTAGKKQRRNKREMSVRSWIIIAVAVTITLSVVGYFIIKTMLH